METIEEAKVYLNANYKDGVACPCCNQFVKEYKRNIYSRVALMLISLYKIDSTFNGPNRYVHIDSILSRINTEKGQGDFAKLAYWDFILEEENTDTKKRTSGKWMITESGKSFVERRLQVKKYMHVLTGSLRKSSGPMVDIVDCLGKDFNYQELMSL